MYKLKLDSEKKKKKKKFHLPRKQVTTPKLEIDGTSIECVNSFNRQGQKNSIANKVSKYIGILNKLKKYVSPKTLLLVYNSFILSSLDYRILVWGYNTDRLFKLQKRAVRVISKSKFNAHTNLLFQNLEILKIGDPHKLHVLKFYYKLIYKNIPQYLYTNMILAQHSHFYRIIK